MNETVLADHLDIMRKTVSLSARFFHYKRKNSTQMKTKILKIDPLNIDPDLIEEAASVIKKGGLVAFPTETVYGLGANALDPKAITGIFEAKERPLDDPLIVHVAEVKEVYELAENVPLEAEKLIKSFWPGPLTIILKKNEKIPDIVTTGLETVAIRMPSNPIAKELIRASGVPIAAPSANLFGRPSPTKAEHVINDLDARVDIIIDGGKTDIGIESTVIEIAGGGISVLRPGGISIEHLKGIVGKVEVSPEPEDYAKSPGKYPQHYSPLAEVVIAENNEDQTNNVKTKAANLSSDGKRVGVLAKEEHAGEYRDLNVKILGPEKDGKTCASNLFHLFREFDEEKVDVIIAEEIEEFGLGLAVMNRLRKAVGF